MKSKIYDTAKEIAAVVFGAALFAVSLNMFLLPAQVVQGGVTGIATALNLKYGVGVGTVILAVNVPLILANIKVNGIPFIIKSAVGVALTGVLSDYLNFFPVTLTDPFLCALFGGITMGVGCGIMFTRGYTTGGTDLMVFLARKRWEHLSVGRLTLIFDALIVVGAAVLLNNFLGIFYSALAIFTQTTVVDLVLNGADRTKLFFVITENEDSVASALAALNRGVTLLSGHGYHTERQKSVIMCVVKPHQVYAARTAVASADPAAFTVIADCSQTYGQGFKSK